MELPSPTWFVGCGNMAGAMVEGWRAARVDMSKAKVIRPSGKPGRRRPHRPLAGRGGAGRPRWSCSASSRSSWTRSRRARALGDRRRSVVSILAGVEVASLRTALLQGDDRPRNPQPAGVASAAASSASTARPIAGRCAHAAGGACSPRSAMALWTDSEKTLGGNRLRRRRRPGLCRAFHRRAWPRPARPGPARGDCRRPSPGNRARHGVDGGEHRRNDGPACRPRGQPQGHDRGGARRARPGQCDRQAGRARRSRLRRARGRSLAEAARLP